MSSTLTASKFLSDREIEKLKESLKFLELRGRLMISMLMNLGMRGAELLEIRLCEVNIGEGFIQVPGKKNSRPRTFPIPDVLERDLKEYFSMQIGEPNRPLFEITISGVKKIWGRVRPVKKGLHSLRHTFAITVFERTRDIKLVQVCLGHRSIANTMVYADFVYSRDEMKRILSKNLYDGVNSHAKA